MRRWLGVSLSFLVAAASAAPPARTASSPAKSTQPRHIVMVIEENRSFNQIIGNKHAPFINALARQTLLLTHSYAVAHPSEPNYLALFSGSTHGVTDDACSYHYSSPNLASELRKAGLSFTSYSESMPSVGFTGCRADAYRRKHNPIVNWQRENVPARLNKRWTDFPRHYRNLPTVAFVIPNQNHDMHDGTVAQADHWLKAHLSDYIHWAKHHRSWLLLTWDEGTGSENHVVTVVAGAGIGARRCKQHITHYSVLRLLEDIYNLPRLGKSKHASAIACGLK